MEENRQKGFAMMPDSTPLTVATLQSEMRGVQTSIEEIKAMMTRIVSLSEAVAVIQRDSSQHETNISRAFKAIENTVVAVNDLRHAFNERIEKHEDEAGGREKEIREAISDLKMETHAWMNQARGGAKVMSVAWLIFGAIIIGILGWAGTEALKMRDTVHKLQGAVELLADDGKLSASTKANKAVDK